MPFITPRPLEDDAWRTGDAAPGVAHCYGWDLDRDGRSKCWARIAIAGTRQATEDDVLCPDCEAWYWQGSDAWALTGEPSATAAGGHRPSGHRRRGGDERSPLGASTGWQPRTYTG